MFPSSKHVADVVASVLSGLGVGKVEAIAETRAVFGSLLVTDLYHKRGVLAAAILTKLGAYSKKAVRAVALAISGAVRCYAAVLHLRHGANDENPLKFTNKGYATKFEKVTEFPGRMEQAAKWSDLSGTKRPGSPWLDGLPRLIFVSDMGDALSAGVSFEFQKKEIVDVATSLHSRAHVWLWLTKRPARMVRFSRWLEAQGVAWPDNLVPMTSVMGQKMAKGVSLLAQIPAKVRGLSVEPLWENVELDLTGIDWCLVGGESGFQAEPFDLAWARSLRDHARKCGVAFFMKQLGTKPQAGGQPVVLKDKHGGEWDEWPEDLRVREFPPAFLQIAEPRKGARKQG
ncbi:DUF5131 family protein [Luteolibacter luteus]|uniref:DUF5131 family protein n=1 Tax=Luteolibacter luteus TaxID=2728835 RepID=A0A858RFR1_9BACT|nr:DUF5131 family protein [Luteolibacter luteus]QJE95279.1 DUF5131 family protein [Luteolibacter luteus]